MWNWRLTRADGVTALVNSLLQLGGQGMQLTNIINTIEDRVRGVNNLANTIRLTPIVTR